MQADVTPAVRALFRDGHLMPLGPGSPNRAGYDELRKLTIPALCAPHALHSSAAAQGCLAALWLLHDFFDESHHISQEIATADGSYWHAILHRREPDAANAMYWFRRVGAHPVLAQLAEQAPALGYSYTNPQDFVELCERVRDTGTPDEHLAQRVQQLEWQLLFDHCYRSAIGV